MAYIETPSLATNDFFTIKFIHLPTETEVQFKGWVNEFSDQFTSIWNETPVYGRMDPMSTFHRTSRQISMAFSVVSDSRQEAVANLADSILNRLCKLTGGTAYTWYSPLGGWLEDVRALGFLRPPWALAYEQLFNMSINEQ